METIYRNFSQYVDSSLGLNVGNERNARDLVSTFNQNFCFRSVSLPFHSMRPKDGYS